MGSSTKNAGFTLVEVLIAISLLMLLSVGSLAANSLATGTIVINQQRSRANFLAREAMEAVHSIRAGSFTSIVAGIFHPIRSGSGWALQTGPETIGGFVRQIEIANVMRQISCDSEVCDIVQGGGVYDEGSYQVRVRVSWNEAGDDKSYEIDSLITYWR